MFLLARERRPQEAGEGRRVPSQHGTEKLLRRKPVQKRQTAAAGQEVGRTEARSETV